jgi:hypothetical protein
MAKIDATPKGRSQKLTSPDMVTLDRKTCHELGKLIGQSIDQLQDVCCCEIMLTSLEYHLSELADEESAGDRNPDKSFEIGKGILLLRYWLGCVPQSQSEIAGRLQDAFKTLQTVLVASELGGGDE